MVFYCAYTLLYTRIKNLGEAMRTLFLQAGVIFAGLAVGLGAFTTHYLKSRVEPDMMSIFEVGVRYQMYHSLALILVGVLLSYNPNRVLVWTGFSFIAGVIIFSGSLYLLSLSGVKVLGAITPIGGVLFLVGWFLFLIAIIY